MKRILTLLLALMVLSLMGCTNKDNYPSILTEDIEIVICFENLTNHILHFEGFQPSWHVSDFTVDPQSEWSISFIKKKGEQDIFILTTGSFIVYADNIRLADITGKETDLISPAHHSYFSTEHYEATRDSVAKSVYTFTITEEVVDAWEVLN